MKSDSSGMKIQEVVATKSKSYSRDIANDSRPRGYKTLVNLKLKIKRNDWLLADTCPQAANHCPLF